MHPDSVNEETRWRRRSQDDCAWAKFADGHVLYHRPSGKTHVMNDAGVALLNELLSEPTSLAEVLGVFRVDSAGVDEQEFVDSMATLLLRLEEFGLVDRV